MDNRLSQSERTGEKEDTSFGPMVTIITPVLNCVKYLEMCIESALNQGYPHVEHVFIDGVLTDGTVDVLSSYSAKYFDSVRFISVNSATPSMIPLRLLDTTKAEKALGFKAVTGLRDKIRETIEWYGNDR